jgi:putative tricarboxylic transport membrane protein
MVAILLVGARWFLRVVTVPKSILIPVILVLCAVGAYALGNTIASVYLLLVFGVVGYLMVKGGLPLAPLILGVVLGDQIEINLLRSIMTDADPWLFLTRPISGGLLVASVASMALAFWQHRRHQRKAGAAEESADF